MTKVKNESVLDISDNFKDKKLFFVSSLEEMEISEKTLGKCIVFDFTYEMKEDQKLPTKCSYTDRIND